MAEDNKNVNEEVNDNDELNLDELEDIQGGDIGNAMKIKPKPISGDTSSTI
jgi:hypothetical protein